MAKSGIVQLKEGEKWQSRLRLQEADSGSEVPSAARFEPGIFDLAYADAYPDGMDTFVCHQTKVIVGDPYGEF
jgi:hypothetical protein